MHHSGRGKFSLCFNQHEMKLNGQLHSPAFCHGRILAVHWMRDWVVTRAGPDAMDRNLLPISGIELRVFELQCAGKSLFVK